MLKISLYFYNNFLRAIINSIIDHFSLLIKKKGAANIANSAVPSKPVCNVRS